MAPPFDARLDQLLGQAENLPTLPAVALEVLRLCRSEETTLDDLARALASDPALAARLLRFANSSLYSPGEKVSTLQRATLVLGLKTVQLMSLSFSLIGAVPRGGQAGSFDYALYWRRSLVRAVAARTLAGSAFPPAQDEAFLVGLLAEIGQVVLARGLASEYAAVLAAARARGERWPSAEGERAQLGFDHRDVGGALLRSWQLPPVLSRTLESVGASELLPPETPAEIRKLSHILTLAGRIADFFTLKGGADALAELEALAARWCDLTPEALRALLAHLEEPLKEAAALLEITALGAERHAELLAAAHEELARRTLGQSRELHSLRTAVDASLQPADEWEIDPRTGCANAAGFQRMLAQQVLARVDGNLARPLGLLRIVLDGAEFEAERALASLLARLTRKQDLAAQLGPGSFALILGDATTYGLRKLAERLLAQQARLSIGGACLGAVASKQDGAALLEVTERLLRKAQERGPGHAEVHATLLRGK